MRHVMTAARKRALRKAQMVSARLRKGHGRALKNVGAARKKISPGHKRAIKVVAAGTVLAGGAFGAYNAYNSAYVRLARANRPVQRPPGSDNSPNMTKRRHMAISETGDIVHHIEKNDSIAIPSKEVKLTTQHKAYTRVQHPLAKSIMAELNGKPVKGYYEGIRSRGNHKVIFGEGVSGSK